MTASTTTNTGIDTIFCDVGGVILTNGWDKPARTKVVADFDLDWEEFDERHKFIVDRFETGRCNLDDYLRLTVGHRPRDFSLDAFGAAMSAQSVPLDGGLELVEDLAATNLRLATLNNESRPLNDHRIATFGLASHFELFFSSAYLGVKKPDDAIYRMALEVTAASPQRCVFIDDRQPNLEPAMVLGIHTIHHQSVQQTRQELTSLGVVLGSAGSD